MPKNMADNNNNNNNNNVSLQAPTVELEDSSPDYSFRGKTTTAVKIDICFKFVILTVLYSYHVNIIFYLLSYKTLTFFSISPRWWPYGVSVGQHRCFLHVILYPEVSTLQDIHRFNNIWWFENLSDINIRQIDNQRSILTSILLL